MTVTWVSTDPERRLWDELVCAHPAGSAYLLSWYLAEQQLPRSEAAIAIVEHGRRAVAGAVVYTFRLPGRLGVCVVPSGPIARNGHEECLGKLVEAVAEHARAQSAVLLQFEAFEAETRDVIRDGLARERLLDEAVWKLYHPTLWRELRVPLSDKTPETLLAGFTASTRQRVREAIRKKVEVAEVCDSDGIDEVHALWTAAGEDRQYTIRPRDSFRALVRAAAERKAGCLLTSRVDGRLAAFVFSAFHGAGSIYLYGGHRPEVGGGFANRILQYEMMCRALKRGIPWYSLGGPATGGIREYKLGFRPVLIDNMRFVSVLLKPAKAWMLGKLVGQPQWAESAKRWAARSMVRGAGVRHAD